MGVWVWMGRESEQKFDKVLDFVRLPSGRAAKNFKFKNVC